MHKLPTAAIIGAGSSGIAAAKALHERGIPFTCFEASDRIGGNWVFGNKNGMSAAYRDLHINTSRDRMEYSDYPMPKTYPDFPHHTQIAEYFEAYVDHFGFRDAIRYETKVLRAQRLDGGGWELTVANPDPQGSGGVTLERFDSLLVANGHHWDPRMPEPMFAGADSFTGTQIHAHAYVDNSLFEGKDVVILGMGNSAMDIAVESSYVAAKTYLAARRGAWVVPKYVLGRPLDQFPLAVNPRVPFKVRQKAFGAALKLVAGSPERYGLPKPDHEIMEAHPTISGRILDRITHGKVLPRPNIERLEGDHVVFTDGTRVHADVVVYCTGYKISFPFFDEGFISAPDNHIELFRRVFHPDHDDLFFVALLQPLGATMPLAEAQGKWIASYLRGEYALPSPAAMRKDIADDLAAMRKRYVASKRHTIQVDFDAYLYELGKERRAGDARARERGFSPPLAAGAGVDGEEAVAA
jgi:cation diffusion facilitator CzcD-associated flavoprotein CzcO